MMRDRTSEHLNRTDGPMGGEVKTDDFLSNNVNAFAGHLVICDSYVVRLYPSAVAEVAAGNRVYEYAPESTHIDQFGFKLSTILRLRRATSLTTVTKDGSPHSVQIPLIAQEAAQNTGFPLSGLKFVVIENGHLVSVSNPAVRAARHLSEVESLIAARATTKEKPVPEFIAPSCGSDVGKVAILVGGRCDLDVVKRSRLLATLETMGVPFTVSVISSEQNPEELRSYCHRIVDDGVCACICVAGLVPGLPAAVKAHAPSMPVISVPISTPDFHARDIMMSSFSLPSRRPVILSGLNESGLNKAAHLVCELIAVGSPAFRHAYTEFIRRSTPTPDYDVDVAAARPPLERLSIEHRTGTGSAPGEIHRAADHDGSGIESAAAPPTPIVGNIGARVNGNGKGHRS